MKKRLTDDDVRVARELVAASLKQTIEAFSKPQKVFSKKEPKKIAN